MHIVVTILAILLLAALHVIFYIFSIVMVAENCPEGADAQEYLYKCMLDSMHYTNQSYL